jgi:hypothetical protein
MINHPEILRKFEDDFIRDQGPMPYEQARRLFTGMWREGILLGGFPPAESLEGIDVDIRVAGILNACLTKPLLE